MEQQLEFRKLVSPLDNCNQNLFPPSIFFNLQSCFCIEALLNQKRIGLCIIEKIDPSHCLHYYSHTFGILRWLMIHPNYRRRGCGTKLLKFSEEVARLEGLEALGFEYRQEDPHLFPIEDFFCHAKWPKPELKILRCYFNPATFHPVWMNHVIQLPASYSLFEWSQLRTSERQTIELMQDQHVFRPYLSPFNHQHKIHKETSLGLRNHSKVMGWCVTHQMRQGLIRYSTIYVNKELRLYGGGMTLLKESIQRLKRLSIPLAMAEFNIEDMDRSWQIFTKKRLLPHATEIEKVKWTLKLLTKN